MRNFFRDERNFPLMVAAMLLVIPLFATLVSACTKPRTPKEMAEVDVTYAENLKDEIVIVTPRPGVECYVLRGISTTNTRTMSCVVNPPTTFGN